jgi:hypothetical protein
MGLLDGATTSSVLDSAKSLIESGPASAISGIKDSISGAVGSVTQGLGNLLNGIGAGIVPSNKKLPMPNILHSYATYNYIFTLSCLDANSYNFPATSYFAGKLGPIILKSGSGSPDNRIKLPGGKWDYFIDSLTLTGQYGFEKGTGNTNSTNIEFTVIEPYSMGMFMIACQTAAYNQGYNNYNEAPFLLTIEFRGNTEDGKIANVPGTKKFVPFNLNQIQMKVTGAGSTYSIVGVIANAVGLKDSYKSLKSDVTVSGKSVQEILQSGPRSLQQVINERFKEQKSDGAVAIPDEVLILFPTDTATVSNGQALSTGQVETKSSATTSTAAQINDPKLFQQLGVTRSSSATNTSLIQKPGDINALGKATLGFDVTKGGAAPFSKEGAVWDDKTKTWSRSNTNPTPGQVDFKFTQASDITNAINQVLLKSQVASDALDPKLLSKEGMRPWWRIDVQTYHIASNANMKITGQVPKLLVYRVVPYKVHASRLMAPNTKPPGFAELKKQAAKEYNYIYTGKNIDLLKFEIDISNTFYQVFMADQGKRTDGKVLAGNQGGTDKDPKQAGDTPVPQGGAPAKPGQQSSQAKSVATTTSTDNKGGTRGETSGNRAARLFHDAMLEGMDMQNITFDIMGDPYYIANSGAGNYTASSTNLINVTKDGDINYTNGEVDVVINFRTPTDINQSTGLYDFKNTQLVTQFSGMYKLNTIVSNFKGGQFTQTLSGMRRPGQDFKSTTPSTGLVSAKTEVKKNTGSAALDPAKNSDPATSIPSGAGDGKVGSQ